MTSNQIDYYNARMKAKNDRLTRKEQKRHNKVTEGAQQLSAQAALSQAASSQQQANIAQKRYELDWETEYGFEYGTPREDMNDPSNYDKITSDAVFSIKRGAQPATYTAKQFQIIKDYGAGKQSYSTAAKNLANAVESATKAGSNLLKTFQIITE